MIPGRGGARAADRDEPVRAPASGGRGSSHLGRIRRPPASPGPRFFKPPRQSVDYLCSERPRRLCFCLLCTYTHFYLPRTLNRFRVQGVPGARSISRGRLVGLGVSGNLANA